MNWLKATEAAGEYWASTYIGTPDTLETASMPEITPKKIQISQPWTLEEEERLGKLAKEYNYNWKAVAEHFYYRSATEIESRWVKRFDINVKKTPWTKEEDAVVSAMVEKFGKNWKEISKYVPGRLPCTIKNRFYSTINKSKVKKKCEIITKIPEHSEDDALLDSLLDLSDNKAQVFEIKIQEDTSEGKLIEQTATNNKDEKIQIKKVKFEMLQQHLQELERFLADTKEQLKKYEADKNPMDN